MVEVEVKVEVDIVINEVCDLCIVIDSCNKINENLFLMMFHFVVICTLLLVLYISVSVVSCEYQFW